MSFQPHRSLKIAVPQFVIILVLFVIAASVQAEPVRIDIEGGQPLKDAINEFARQADQQVLVASEAVEGMIAPTVSGAYEPEIALALLLADTGLNASVSGEQTFVISRADTERSENQNSAPQQNQQERNNANQNRNRDDEAENDESDEDDVADLGRITVTASTGTNIRGLENPAVPVIRFDKEDIEITGAATVEDFLRTVPQNFSNIDSAISSASGDPAASQNSTSGSAVNLRGVGLGATLTLLNGRRLPNSSGIQGNFVDISGLPLGAIERIDVQTDGASAVYGSDAVAGVVNIITSESYDGVEMRGGVNLMEGGGEQYRVGLTAGTYWQGGGAFASVDFLDVNPLSNSDREFIDLSITPADSSLVAENEMLSFVGSINQDFSNRLSGGVDVLYSSRDTVSKSPRAVGSDQILVRDIDVQSLIVNTRINYDFSDEVVASLFLDYAEEESSRIDLEPDAFSVDRRSNLFTIEGQVSGVAIDLPSGPLAFAFGALQREEKNEALRSDTATSDLVDAERDVTAVYGEFLIPIVGKTMSVPAMEQLDLSVAARYVDYSDFGDNISPKVGLSWRVNDEFALRGTYSESFRAPSLSDTAPRNDRLVANLLPSSLFSGLPPQDARLPDGTVASLIVGGASLLTEETAEIWSTGFEYQPNWLFGLRIEGSYFDISYTDRIETVGLFDVLFNPTFSGLLVTDPDATLVAPFLDSSIFQNLLPFEPNANDFGVLLGPLTVNLSERDVRGFDLLAAYERDTDIGTFSTSLNLTHIAEYLAQLTPNAPEVDEVGSLYRPSALRLRSTTGIDYNGLSGSITLNYTDDYQDLAIDEGATDIDAWLTVDLSLAYTPETESSIFSDTRISLAIRNLFNEDPPFVETPIDGLNFDSANANPFGRVVSLQFRKAF